MSRSDGIDGWLMVIDMQFAFSRPGSRWRVGSYDRTRAAVRELVPLFGDRVVYTRFVPPAQELGSWGPYYERWSEFTRERAPLPTGAGDSEWDIDLGDVSVEHLLDAPTFSKWVPDGLPAALLESREVHLCGVAFECCVLGTALAAIDDGASVHVVADAVGASSEPMMDATLTVLGARVPQLTITRLSELRAAAGGA